MSNYSICNQIISFKYLENSQVKNKEVEIILPDRAELCNEEGLALVFELNKLTEKRASQTKLQLAKFLNSFEFESDQEKTYFLEDQNKINPLRQIEILANFNVQEPDYSEKDYLFDIYKLLIKKIYQPNYEPDFNWFNPSIQFEKFVQSYLEEFTKYQNVFLATGPEVEEKTSQKMTGTGGQSKTTKVEK